MPGVTARKREMHIAEIHPKIIPERLAEHLPKKPPVFFILFLRKIYTFIV